MKFHIPSLQHLQDFQKQCIHVRLSELPHGTWKSDMSSRLFESVHFSIRKLGDAERPGIIHTSLLRSHYFLTGSSLLNSVDPVKGGVIRFPIQDLLKVWVGSLHLPETLAAQEFLDKIFRIGYELNIVIMFAKPQMLYYTDIPYKVLPILEMWMESSSLVKTRNGTG